MEGEPHKKAAKHVREEIEREFNGQVKEDMTGMRFYNKVPDITFVMPSGNFMVVEIGNTDAEKLEHYLNHNLVEEIRWYSRTPALVGHWAKNAKTLLRNIMKPFVPHQLFKKAIKTEALNMQRDVAYLNHIVQMMDVDAYALCPGCLKPFRIKNGKMVPWTRREILCCPMCNSADRLDVIDAVYKLPVISVGRVLWVLSVSEELVKCPANSRVNEYVASADG